MDNKERIEILERQMKTYKKERDGLFKVYRQTSDCPKCENCDELPNCYNELDCISISGICFECSEVADANQ